MTADPGRGDPAAFLSVLTIEPAWEDDRALDFRISPDGEAALTELLDSNGIRYTTAVELSGSDLVPFVVYGVGAGAALGGFAGIAAVLTALFNRHNGKKWTAVIGGDEYSATGCSEAAAVRWIDHLLEKRAAQRDK